MAKTRNEIALKVLYKAGRAAIGNTPNSALLKIAKEAYDARYTQLLKNGLVNWALSGSVPEEAVTPIVLLVTIDCGDMLGMNEQRLQRMILQERLALKQLAEAFAPTYEAETTRTDYF